MVAILPSALSQFIDANGNPYAAGTINTYVPGTTNPVSTWQDAAQSALNTNPIRLDAAGRCAIYATGTVRTILKDALGNLVWDKTVAAGDSFVSSALMPVVGASSTDSAVSLLNYFPIGTGAVARNVRAKLREIVSVQDFGAVGDGLTDDTAAINAAIAATSATIGGTVLFPNARYLVSGSLTVAHSNVCLVGAGIFATSIVVQTHNFHIFNITATGQVVISDMQVQSFATGATEVFAVNDASSCYRLRLERLQISGVFSGISATGSEFRMESVFIYNIQPGTGSGLIMNQASGEEANLDNCWFQNAAGSNARAGILVLRVSALTIQNTQLIKMGTCLWVAPASGINVFSIKTVNLWCDTSIGYGVFLDGTAGAIFRVDLDRGWMSSCAAGVVMQGIASGVKIAGCEIFGNTGAGIQVAASATVTGLIIEGNQIAGNGGNGITIGAGASNFGIYNNCVGPAADFTANAAGIVIATGGSDGFVITGNRLRSNTGAALTNGATGGSTVVANNLT